LFIDTLGTGTNVRPNFADLLGLNGRKADRTEFLVPTAGAIVSLWIWHRFGLPYAFLAAMILAACFRKLTSACRKAGMFLLGEDSFVIWLPRTQQMIDDTGELICDRGHCLGAPSFRFIQR
jgi:hypothetical protein